jgi:predicted helicase
LDEFNRELIHKYIPNTLGIPTSIFKFISFEEPPKALEVLIDDITEILCVTDIQKILHTYYSEECNMANKVKHQDPILVIMGNPPYSGASENSNAWTEDLLKKDTDGAQSYYTIDGTPLGEKNPKWLQDDYVKFLRFAQWKIHKAGKGIVLMLKVGSLAEATRDLGLQTSSSAKR